MRGYLHNIFTTNYRPLVVIGSNLNLILRLLFCPNSNNMPLMICCKNVMKMLWTYHFTYITHSHLSYLFV